MAACGATYGCRLAAAAGCPPERLGNCNRVDAGAGGARRGSLPARYWMDLAAERRGHQLAEPAAAILDRRSPGVSWVAMVPWGGRMGDSHRTVDAGVA